MVFTNKNVDDSENNDDIDETPFHNDFFYASSFIIADNRRFYIRS